MPPGIWGQKQAGWVRVRVLRARQNFFCRRIWTVAVESVRRAREQYVRSTFARQREAGVLRIEGNLLHPWEQRNLAG